MKKMILASALLLPLTLSGCIVSVDGDGEYGYHSDWKDEQRDNRKKIARLEPQTGVDKIRSRFGTPDFSELYQKQDDEILVLFYRTHHRESDGQTTKDECTPLVFKNGLLVGWGDSAYESI